MDKILNNNGCIILAYKKFNEFLAAEQTWDNYQKIVLDAFPEMQYVHNTYLKWGSIDQGKFSEKIEKYKRHDFERFFNQYNENFINKLYNSIINKAHNILKPVSADPVDLCLFLPYGGCFVNKEDSKTTIFMSLRINPKNAYKIMAHEYAHVLHMQRRPDEPLTLKREIISEGIAVYLTTLMIDNIDNRIAIPFMPESSYQWCEVNEQLIKDTILPELENNGEEIFFRFISDGKTAKPPNGFVEKTAYYIGYRIIQLCIKKGLKLEEICAYDSETIIRNSEYFHINK